MLTVEQLQARLRALHAEIGGVGRFSLTLDQDPRGPCYVTHWFRPARYAPLRFAEVGSGTPAECLAALEAYARAWNRRPAEDDDRPGPALHAAYAVAAE